MERVLESVKKAVIDGHHQEIEGLVREGLAQGVEPGRLINEALIAAMDVVGERFSRSEIFVPEMLVSALTMKKGLEIIKPQLQSDQAEPRGTILMGTVKGDLHDIGKNLVITMLEGAGFRVIDLGVDVPATRFVDAVREHGPGVVGLGALLTTALARMGETIAALKELDPAPPVMVGGAAVTAEAGERLGADGYAGNAKQAVDLAAHLVAPQ